MAGVVSNPPGALQGEEWWVCFRLIVQISANSHQTVRIDGLNINLEVLNSAKVTVRRHYCQHFEVVMKKPTKAALYKEVEALRAEILRLKTGLELEQAEVSRLKTLLSKVWQSRRSARFWLKDAREEVGQLISSLLSKI